MKVIAPGKLVLTGAYAVLEGAPAIVVAVDWYAMADTESPTKIDTKALYDGAGQKLGLGSSAASQVASFGARALARGDDPRHAAVRAEIFRAVRDAHRREQGEAAGSTWPPACTGGRSATPSRAPFARRARRAAPRPRSRPRGRDGPRR